MGVNFIINASTPLIVNVSAVTDVNVVSFIFIEICIL
jgi:hypothetical protein